ncbi:MAG: hypothetical protein QF491_18585, partial [Alphaproteobacteria bacterium]|nr:hypothetical protein [Alphaproteobacteria bacterium]
MTIPIKTLIRSLLPLVTLIAVAVVWVRPSLAYVTYDYTGNFFNYFGGSLHGPTNYLRGWFRTDAPLAASQPLLDVTASSGFDFRFEDGIVALYPSLVNAGLIFDISTDATGNVDDWRIVLNHHGGVDIRIDSSSLGSTGGMPPRDQGALIQWETHKGGISENPGSWTTTASGGNAVAEPSTLVIFLFGLAWVFLARRYLRRKAGEATVAAASPAIAALAMLGLAFAAIATPAAAAPYSLSLVAAPGQSIGGVTLTHVGSTTESLGFNNDGTVAFRGYFSGGIGIFTQDDLLARNGDSIGGHALASFHSDVAVNDSGVTAFIGYDANWDSGVFTQNDAIANLGDVIDGHVMEGAFRSIDINNAGEVAFINGRTSLYNGLPRYQNLYTQNGFVAGNGTVLGGITMFSLQNGVNIVSINDDGVIAFAAHRSSYPSNTSHILTSDDRLIARHSDIVDGHWVSPGGRPAINNTGNVAYFANTGSGTNGVFTDNDLLAMVGDSIDGLVLKFTGIPSINDYGEVAFKGQWDVGSSWPHGLFSADSLIAGAGDVVGGRTIN